MKPAPKSRHRLGMTLVETMIAAVLLTIVIVQIGRVLDSARRQGRLGAAVMELEARTSSTMDKIVEGLRSADFPTLQPQVEPDASSPWIEFQTAEGFDGVNPIWTGVQRLELLPGTGRIRWTYDLGSPDERTVFLSDSVPDLAQGETLDGTDENGNGLVDESGLSFCVEDGVLVVRLTLTRPAFEGRPLVRSMEARIVPRN